MMDKIYNNQLTGKLIGCGKHIGFKYYIVTFGTHPCAYISIHPGNDLYGVDYTYIKYVKKPSGSKPGMVIYTHQKSINVN